MTFVTVEVIFAILNIVAYLFFWKTLSFQMSVLMYTTIVITILRIIYGKQNPKELIESRKAMMIWYGIHLTVIMFILLEGRDWGTIILSIISIGPVIWLVYIGFLALVFNLESEVNKSKVSRIVAYSMTFETLAILATQMYNGITVPKVALTLIVIVVAIAIVENSKEVTNKEYEFEPQSS